MRRPPHKAEEFRIRSGAMASTQEEGNNGAFLFNGPCGERLFVIASDGMEWEHVSVSIARKNPRNPNWQEMCFVKDIFFDEEEATVQYHPPKSLYINNHPFCLHIWRPTTKEIPLPPGILVGVK